MTTDERPVDAAGATDSPERFAADLRALRLTAGCPTLSRLEHDTGVSKSVISSAFAGKQLPTARTVDRIARACGGDAAELVRRRDRLAGLASTVGSPATKEPGRERGASTPPSTPPPPADGVEGAAAPTRPAPAPTPSRDADDRAIAVGSDLDGRASGMPEASRQRDAHQRGRRLRAALVVAAAFVLGAAVSAGVSAVVVAQQLDHVRDEAVAAARKELRDSPVSPQAQINVHNGVDPALTPCVNDAEVATSSPRTNNTKLEIIWSNKCYAGWARITRYDEQISGNSMTVAIYPETAAQGPDRQSATEPNVQSAYTTLVVRPTPETRLCAVGVITLDGASIDLGEPLCT